MSPTDDESDKPFDPYQKSTLIQKLHKRGENGKPVRLAFVDIDVTFTSELQIIASTKKRLEQLGYIIIFVTSRTEEMVMSKKEFEKSKTLGFSRPKPYLGIKNGKRIYQDPAKAYPLLVNPDLIIGSTGTQIMVKQQHGGYMPDISFEKQFLYSSSQWRTKVKNLIEKIDPKNLLVEMPAFEFEEMYKKHISNVFPPKFRVQLICKSLQAKNLFLKKLKNHMLPSDFFLNITDDSNVTKNNYIIFLTPINGLKSHAVNHVVKNICKNLGISKEKIEVILAGDSYPDLAMLFYGAKGTKTTAILVGGSRITNILMHKVIHEYAGEDLSVIKENMHSLEGKTGFYSFCEGITKTLKRDIIIGDLAYPHTKGPATILAFLDN